MRAKFCRTAYLCTSLKFILLLSSGAAADNSINSVPDLSDAEHVRKRMRPERVSLATSQPQWDFKPAKNRFLTGETIWGKLTVTNPNKKFSFRFSPPYRGFLVDTIGIWSSKWNEDKKEWGSVEEILKVNQGYSEYQRQLQGKPLLLKSAEKYEASIALNGGPRLERGDPIAAGVPRVEWAAGAGFAKPGKYRVYLQYVNLEALIPFVGRHEKAMVLAPHDGKDKTRPLEAKPIVLGPYEVEVTVPKAKVGRELLKLIESWDKWYRTRETDIIVLLPTAGLEKLLDDPDMKSKELAGVRESLFLTQWTNKLSHLPRGQEARKASLEKLLVQVREARKETIGAPLKDNLGLVECFLTKAIGREGEAIKLANELGTADSQVFVEDIKPRKPGK